MNGPRWVTVTVWLLPLLLIIPIAAHAQAVKAKSRQPRAQAFIPMLMPVARIEPSYPAAARSKNIQGNVEVLLTINPQGFVTEVEVLSGRDVLHQAAVDAVKQWMFRPVIRNGAPVYAIASEMVSFFIPPAPGQHLSMADMAGDVAGEMAAQQRIAELQRQMPRTPAQVLADLEQAVGDVSGMQRFYQLPGLAKAAVHASDFDKATVYATELLQLAEEYSHDWNYGNAIHDGNMVMGVVALHQGNRAQAKQSLLAAGKTPGSPQLDSFGPNVELAKELLQKGERDAVLEYFSLCKKFWKRGDAKLSAWTATVRAGGIPDFGANLSY